MPLPPELMAYLACPFCKTIVERWGDDYIHCRACHTCFPIVDDIPAMCPECAIPETQLADRFPGSAPPTPST